MFSRPSWAFLCFWSGIETVPCYLDFDLVSACSTLIPDALVLGMAVDSLDSHGPSGLVHHNCSNAYFLDHLGVHHLGDEPFITTFTNVGM